MEIKISGFMFTVTHMNLFYTVTTLFFKDGLNVKEISHDETDVNVKKEHWKIPNFLTMALIYFIHSYEV